MRAGWNRGVDCELVERVEAVGRLLAAERGDVLPGLVEPVDVVAGVAIGDVKVAVGRDVEASEEQRQLVAPRVSHFVLIGDRRRADRHDDRAFERHLDDRLSAQRGAVDELAVGLLADHEAVKVAGRAGHVAQERALGREDLQPGLRILHADVHLARGAHGDVAMLVAELLPSLRQLQPVGNDVVGIGGGSRREQRPTLATRARAMRFMGNRSIPFTLITALLEGDIRNADEVFRGVS